MFSRYGKALASSVTEKSGDGKGVALIYDALMDGMFVDAHCYCVLCVLWMSHSGQGCSHLSPHDQDVHTVLYVNKPVLTIDTVSFAIHPYVSQFVEMTRQKTH